MKLSHLIASTDYYNLRNHEKAQCVVNEFSRISPSAYYLTTIKRKNSVEYMIKKDYKYQNRFQKEISNSTKPITFSHQSRKRLKEKLFFIDFDSYKYINFCTMTFSDRIINRQFLFLKRMIKYLSKFKIPYIWKKEFGENNNRIHYHFILPSNKPINIISFEDFIIDCKKPKIFRSRDLSFTLKRIMKPKTLAEFINGFRIDEVQKDFLSFEHIMNYVSKYVVKKDSSNIESSGRWWGCSTNWKLLKPEVQKISDYEYNLLMDKQLESLYLRSASPLVLQGVQLSKNRILSIF